MAAASMAQNSDYSMEEVEADDESQPVCNARQFEFPSDNEKLNETTSERFSAHKDISETDIEYMG